MAKAFSNDLIYYNTKELSSTSLPKILFDNDTLDILHVNDSMAATLGYTADELCRMKLSDLMIDDFSAQLDNEKVQFPAYKIVRQFLNKSGNVINCLSESSEIDFDSNMLIIYNAKYFVQSVKENIADSGILVDNVAASVLMDIEYIKN